MSRELTVIGLYTPAELPPEITDALPHPGDSWTYDELLGMLTPIAERTPPTTVRVLVSGYGDDWFDRHLLSTSSDGVDLEGVQLSLSEGDPQPAISADDAAPEGCVRLDTPAAPFVAELNAMGEDGDSACVGEDPNELVLPFFLESMDVLLDVAVRLSPHLEEDVRCLVRVRGRFGWLSITREDGVSLSPVFYWHEDAAVRAWLRSELAPHVPPMRRPPPAFGTVAELRAYVAKRYESSTEHDELVSVLWSWSGTPRTQQVVIYQQVIVDEPWIVVRSSFAPTEQVSLEAVFEHCVDSSGSLVREHDAYALQLVLPLQALTAARLDSILALIASEADDAEEALLGTDEY